MDESYLDELYQDYKNDWRKRNVGKKAVCLIDETGTGHPRHPSKLFIVSGIILPEDQYREIIQATKVFSRTHNKPIDKINLKGSYLTQHQKLEFASLISTFNYKTIHVIFDKEGIKNSRYGYLADPSNYPQMYLVALRNVIERSTWYAKQERFDKVDFYFDQKDSILPSEVLNYSFTGSGKCMLYTSHMGTIKQVDKTHPAISIADFNASSLGKLEKINQYNVWDDQIARLINKGRFFDSEHPKYKGVLNNGIKLQGITASEFLTRYCRQSGSEIFSPISPQGVIAPL